MQYMTARPILRDKITLASRIIIERVVWEVGEPVPGSAHRFKYRLYCGRGGQCLVRYDNETGKGDHVHYGEDSEPYYFVSLDQLLSDFEADLTRLSEM